MSLCQASYKAYITELGGIHAIYIIIFDFLTDFLVCGNSIIELIYHTGV